MQVINIFVQINCKKIFKVYPQSYFFPKCVIWVCFLPNLNSHSHTHMSIDIQSLKTCRHFPVLTLLVITAPNLVFMVWNLLSWSLMWDFLYIGHCHQFVSLLLPEGRSPFSPFSHSRGLAKMLERHIWNVNLPPSQPHFLPPHPALLPSI